MPATPPADTAFTLVPDWICEVLSPSTASIDRASPSPGWPTPLERVLSASQRAGDQLREIDSWRGDADTKVRAPPFDALELDLSSLWPPAPP